MEAMKTHKLFVVEYRITNETETIDKDGYAHFSTLKKAKAFLDKGIKEWDGTGKGIGNGQIVELEIWPDGDLPFPAYHNSKRLATYTPTMQGYHKQDDTK